jgi:hypothetical protein
VVNHQPCLFGVGLFQLSGPNSINALVQHGPYQIGNNVFVRFVPENDLQNHRSVQGYRNGWLMFLGVPGDYRNDIVIANAVSTFGKYHFWNNLDPLKTRILVYASFPSLALVPRDVVFGKFSSAGGIKEGWTAPVYILSADFADVIPADEDQMPPDGNPHPLPGNMQLNPNMFALPQFPELGWDAVPLPENQQDAHGNQQHDFQNEDVEEQQIEQVVEEQHSMVLSMSDVSHDSINMQEPVVPFVPQQQGQFDMVQLGFVSTVFGPVLPPEMLWSRIFQAMLPELLTTKLPASLSFKSASPLVFSKRTWTIAFDYDNSYLLTFTGSSKVQPNNKAIVHPRRRSVARALCFDDVSESSEEHLPPVFAATPVSSLRKKGRGRPRKIQAPLVEPENRRFTRSSLKSNGFRPSPVVQQMARPKKKPRAKMLICQGTMDEEGQSGSKEKVQIPATPIQTMQKVGVELGIDPEKLSREKLEAAPSSSTSECSND